MVLLVVLTTLFVLILLPKIFKSVLFMYLLHKYQLLAMMRHHIIHFSNRFSCSAFFSLLRFNKSRAIIGMLKFPLTLLLEALDMPNEFVSYFTQILPTFHPRTTSRIPDCCRHSNCPIPYWRFSSGALSNSSTFPSRTRSSMT